MIKLVDAEGRTIWETPGPANARVFHVDQSMVACWGKDPRVLDEVAGGDRTTLNWANLVEDKYQESDNRIVILDTETGSQLLSLDIPSASGLR